MEKPFFNGDVFAKFDKWFQVTPFLFVTAFVIVFI